MGASAVILVSLKATVLFLCGLACLRLARRWSPAMRHLICLGAIAGSLAVVPTMFVPAPAWMLHVPSVAGSAVAGSAGAKNWAWLEFAEAIWASGCALVAIRFLIGCWVLLRLRRSATPLGWIIFTADVSVPIVTGLFRPAILLPPDAADWPEQQRNAAIQHELAHLQRRDLWANLAGAIACALYWFHPLVWVLARRLREEQENACDDAVLEAGFDSAEYAEALLETARAAVGYPLLSCRLADRVGVKERVIRVLSSRLPSSNARPVVRGASRLVFAATMFLLAGLSLIGAEQVYKVGDTVTVPTVIQKTDPLYTAAAKSAKIQGRVLVGLVVGSDGMAKDIAVEHGIDKGLDQNAIQALRQWRFKPAELGGKPVAVRAKIEFNFQLR